MIRLWGCLTLAGLLLAGCAFDPRGSSSSGPESDAGGFSSSPPDAGKRPIDAAAAAPDAAPPVEPVLLETLTIDVSEQDPVDSTVVLLAGRTYRLVAYGTAVVRDDEIGQFDGDADYWFNDILGPGDTSGGVDMGLAVNDTSIDGNRSPDWGDYADSHVYETTMAGNDSVLTAQFHDPDYGNGNSGSLTLEIWGPPP